MSAKPLNRQSLKSLFSKGKKPNAKHFESLIDSTINQADDGISKNFKDGLTLAPEGKDSSRLMSFKDKIQNNIPKWGIDITQKNTAGLAIVEPVSATSNKTRLFIENGGNIGIGTVAPKTTLEVNGISASDSRIGTHKLATVPADGKWHAILTGLDGCNAFEIMAQVGKKNKGRYALLHAHALSTFGKSRNKIRKTQAHYDWKWWNKLNLRWAGDTYDYRLELKSRSDYGEDHKIKFYITKLWDNEIMNLFNQQ